MELEAALHGRESELTAAVAAAAKVRAEREREQEMERARKSKVEAEQARAAEENLRLTEEARGDQTMFMTLLSCNIACLQRPGRRSSVMKASNANMLEPDLN